MWLFLAAAAFGVFLIRQSPWIKKQPPACRSIVVVGTQHATKVFFSFGGKVEEELRVYFGVRAADGPLVSMQSVYNCLLAFSHIFSAVPRKKISKKESSFASTSSKYERGGGSSCDFLNCYHFKEGVKKVSSTRTLIGLNYRRGIISAKHLACKKLFAKSGTFFAPHKWQF